MALTPLVLHAPVRWRWRWWWRGRCDVTVEEGGGTYVLLLRHLGFILRGAETADGFFGVEPDI